MTQPSSKTQSAQIMSLIERTSGRPWREGNQIGILRNGDEIFPSMLSAIESATVSIEFLSFVFWRSEIATTFTKALAQRAKAGVKVRVLVDAFGGARMSSRAIWQLERSGVTVGWYHPGRWQYLWMLNNRTHRKLLIVDGQIGFTGGVGIADEWTGNAQDPKHFRETHCRVTGPAVADLHVGFADNWPEAAADQAVMPIRAQIVGDIAVHTTISRASSRPSEAQILLHTMFEQARERLWITSAYFVPSPGNVADLKAAARRGVDVRVLTNGWLSNHKLTTMAGRATYQSLLQSGVKIYEYARTTHHAKIMTVDGSWASIGSVNLDARSLVLNDELNISIVDPHTIAGLDQQFLADLDDSVQIKTAAWKRRNGAVRLAEASVSLFAGQL